MKNALLILRMVLGAQMLAELAVGVLEVRNLRHHRLPIIKEKPSILLT